MTELVDVNHDGSTDEKEKRDEPNMEFALVTSGFGEDDDVFIENNYEIPSLKSNCDFLCEHHL